MPKSSSPAAGSRQLVTRAAAAEYFGVSPRSIERWIYDGTLTAYRLGGKVIRIDIAEAEAALLKPARNLGA